MAVTSFALNLLTIYLVFALVHLLSATSCLNLPKRHPDTIQGLVVEEKTRLGSTPPSCHNKCNNCHPCMAVQVPTMPVHNPAKPKSSRATTMENNFDSSSPASSSEANRYSNYKPLGWKCRCGDHFYNP